jgi:hypothetical protein
VLRLFYCHLGLSPANQARARSLQKIFASGGEDRALGLPKRSAGVSEEAYLALSDVLFKHMMNAMGGSCTNIAVLLNLVDSVIDLYSALPEYPEQTGEWGGGDGDRRPNHQMAPLQRLHGSQGLVAQGLSTMMKIALAALLTGCVSGPLAAQTVTDIASDTELFVA